MHDNIAWSLGALPLKSTVAPQPQKKLLPQSSTINYRRTIHLVEKSVPTQTVTGRNEWFSLGPFLGYKLTLDSALHL